MGAGPVPGLIMDLDHRYTLCFSPVRTSALALPSNTDLKTAPQKKPKSKGVAWGMCSFTV